MAITDGLLAEYDHEMGTTRRLLERVVDDRLGWKPHEKSMSLGRLATHLAEIPHWSAAILAGPEFDLSTTAPYQPQEKASRAEILALFDDHVKQTRALIATKSDAEMMSPWTFKKDGQQVFTVPKIGALRSFLMNHTIHHRGQLSVYLRLTGTAVPPIYGPSADEG